HGALGAFAGAVRAVHHPLVAAVDRGGGDDAVVHDTVLHAFLHRVELFAIGADIEARTTTDDGIAFADIGDRCIAAIGRPLDVAAGFARRSVDGHRTAPRNERDCVR